MQGTANQFCPRELGILNMNHISWAPDSSLSRGAIALQADEPMWRWVHVSGDLGTVNSGNSFKMFGSPILHSKFPPLSGNYMSGGFKLIEILLLPSPKCWDKSCPTSSISAISKQLFLFAKIFQGRQTHAQKCFCPRSLWHKLSMPKLFSLTLN